MPKRKQRHQIQALSALTLPKRPGRHVNGNGLYLLVATSGARRWIQRIVIGGRRRDIGLGGYPAVSLAQARDEAATNRAIARKGGDPVATRRKAREVKPTFEVLAKQVHSARKAEWKTGGKHIDQWINTLSTYAFPIIGKTPVDQIESAEVLQILTPIWHTKEETAKRVRQRLETVFTYAKTAGHRTGENPASGLEEALGKQVHVVRHHEAMPYEKVPDFVKWLRTSASIEVVRLSFEFLIITTTRSDDVRSAMKSEVDFGAKTWTIPATRVKTGGRTGQDHVVPLCDRAIAILRRAWELDPRSAMIFPSDSSTGVISENTFISVLESAGSSATAHGFRSSSKDWASEETRHEHFVVEKAMNHVIPDKVEAAYRRGILLKKRTALMADWAHFVETGVSRTTDVIAVSSSPDATGGASSLRATKVKAA
ncbi:MAG: tyrosine-type recombinase/integrase [Hyphomicrobiaceae bacterium]